MPQPASWTDERVEKIIGQLLRAGVILAAAVVFAGGVLYVAKYGHTQPQYTAFHGEPSYLRDVSQIFEQAVSLHAHGLIQFGLLLLIATPVARVAFSVVAFAVERDWLYVAITLIVLAILVYSLTST
ncbi:MAG TPA: DUF1634 domain-containing protein [Candidatus Baltobacteraceae bacterium]|nr:DUF1634 domain-containing protein [Candidatus Baltobacteraceae bacterium]